MNIDILIFTISMLFLAPFILYGVADVVTLNVPTLNTEMNTYYLLLHIIVWNNIIITFLVFNLNVHIYRSCDCEWYAEFPIRLIEFCFRLIYSHKMESKDYELAPIQA